VIKYVNFPNVFKGGLKSFEERPCSANAKIRFLEDFVCVYAYFSSSKLHQHIVSLRIQLIPPDEYLTWKSEWLAAMGRCQRGVNFGAISCCKFLPYFFLTLFLNNSVISWQLKIKIIFDFYNFLKKFHS
jgi:hypothetical protein